MLSTKCCDVSTKYESLSVCCGMGHPAALWYGTPYRTPYVVKTITAFSLMYVCTYVELLQLIDTDAGISIYFRHTHMMRCATTLRGCILFQHCILPPNPFLCSICALSLEIVSFFLLNFVFIKIIYVMMKCN